MSPEAVSMQFYDRNGAPIAPSVTRGHLVDQVLDAYSRSGYHLAPDVLDIRLAEIADKAACSLLRDQWKNDFPVAAYTELLSTVAALRNVLGYSPSRTAVEVFEWVRQQQEESAKSVVGPRETYPVAFLDGPYRGVEMLLEGPLSGPDAGPPYFEPLPVATGDTERPGYETVRYKRADGPDDEGVWPYRLRTDDPAPPEDARPYFAAPTATDGGA
ncbi:hypothetical protein ACGFR8_31495 [Streptomyces brevispora]|uniref:hypothetical protein n=1 Tax=Streptomyces brevispora TaxID=887462 RepID=UPI0037167B03